MSHNDLVLVLNSGSSSLKMAVFAARDSKEEPLYEASAEGIGRTDGKLMLAKADGSVLLNEDHVVESQSAALGKLVGALRPHLSASPVAVGHRVVHGGPHLRDHTRITTDVLDTLAASVHFAPLHIPEALRSIRQAQQLFPDAVHIACFDTAFHRTMAEKATRLAIPDTYAAQGVQRYGFHGLSCESVVDRLQPQVLARLIIAHLGGGCSVTAVRDGSSLDTSMGMSPTGGVPMGTRCGDLDPAVLLYLLRSGLDADAVEQLVNHQCGLYGLSNGESDMQELERKAAAGDHAAALAIDIFCTSLQKTIAGYIALLRGIDLLIFTGGIGEHSSEIRGRILDGMGLFGLDGQRVAVMPAQEELVIARHCRTLLNEPVTTKK